MYMNIMDAIIFEYIPNDTYLYPAKNLV